MEKDIITRAKESPTPVHPMHCTTWNAYRSSALRQVSRHANKYYVVQVLNCDRFHSNFIFVYFYLDTMCLHTKCTRWVCLTCD